VPTAPIRKVIEGGTVKERFWYDVELDDEGEINLPEELSETFLNEKFDQELISMSVEHVTAILKQEIEGMCGDSQKVFIGGYSRGVCIALATWLYFDDGPLGGLFLTQGCLCTPINWSRVDTEVKK
jgi:predicted esterase